MTTSFHATALLLPFTRRAYRSAHLKLAGRVEVGQGLGDALGHCLLALADPHAGLLEKELMSANAQ